MPTGLFKPGHFGVGAEAGVAERTAGVVGFSALDEFASPGYSPFPKGLSNLPVLG